MPSKRSKTTATTRPDNSRFLVAAAKKRHDYALRRVTKAMRTLDRTGQPVTFTAVARAASVSRAWLYGVPELRDAIMALRTKRRRSTPIVPAAQRATTESLRRQLDTTRTEVARLRRENVDLRDELARHHGQLRSDNAPSPKPPGPRR